MGFLFSGTQCIMGTQYWNICGATLLHFNINIMKSGKLFGSVVVQNLQISQFVFEIKSTIGIFVELHVCCCT